MKKKLTLILFLTLVLSDIVTAQSDATIITHPANFYTTNQGAWGKDTTSSLLLEIPIIPEFSINVPKLDQNYITEIAYMDFGVAFEADTWGSLGLKLGIRDKNGRLSINYESNVSLRVPSSFNKGEEITIETDFTPVANKCSIQAKQYNFSMDMILNASFGAYLKAKACAFDYCYVGDLFDFDFDFKDFELFSLNLDLMFAFDKSISIPGDASGAFRHREEDGWIDLWMRKPNKGPSTQSIANKVLYCRSEPYSYDSLTLDVPRTIAKVLKKISDKTSDPAKKKKYLAASMVMKNLDKTLSVGSASVYYNIMKSHLNLVTFHNQLLTFYPKIVNQMKFPTRVDYKILDSLNTFIKSGYDSTISLEVGNKLRFRYPCNFEFMDISSLYSIKNENNFNLDSYDSLSLNFTIEALGFNLKMPNLEVIPGYCFDIPYPCPTWSKPWRWCEEEVCIPAVVFPGFSMNYGPLYSDNFHLADYNYSWKASSWSMKGFNTVPGASFRLTPKQFSATVSPVDIKCYGQHTGSATLTVSNGTPPYKYEWSNGSVTNQASNLGPGTHYVIVTDKNGCTAFDNFVIAEPVAPLSLTDSITDADCNGNNSGLIDIFPTGGTFPYTFIWNNGQTTEDLHNITAGSYSIKITDNKGCILNKSFVVGQPYPLVVTTTRTPVDCYGDSTGSASLTVTGGTGPYQYSWNPGNSNISAISQVAAGTYQYTVTDFNGCAVIQELRIEQPLQPLTTAVIIHNSLCFGEASGSIIAEPAGGTMPYQTVWYDASGQILNQNTTSLESVYAGNYNIRITDANHCSLDSNLTIDQPPLIQWSTQITNNLCYGLSEGMVEIQSSGGTPPIEYLWSNEATGPVISNLPAGTYTVTITDQNACTHTDTAVVSQPATAVTASIIPTHVLCYGESTGIANMYPEGGIPPYTYLWSTGHTGEDLMYVNAGTYYATVTDNNGCNSFTGTVISQPAAPLSILVSVVNPGCNGWSNGMISINASGATPPYYLRWDDTEYELSSKGHVLENLPAGSFDILVTDAVNCELIQAVTLTEPEILSLASTSSTVTCYGGSDGSIDLNIMGGTLPYHCNWSNGANTEDVTGLTSGGYKVAVEDQQGCIAELSTTVNTMPEIRTFPDITPISCIDNYDGSIILETTGGDGFYNYLWSDASTNNNLLHLISGNYSVVITDGLGCARFFDFFVPASPEECIFIPSLFTPNLDGNNDTWIIRNIFLYPENSVKVFSRSGRLVFESSPYTDPWDGTYNGNPLPAETYYYIIDLNNGTATFTGPLTIVR